MKIRSLLCFIVSVVSIMVSHISCGYLDFEEDSPSIYTLLINLNAVNTALANMDGEIVDKETLAIKATYNLFEIRKSCGETPLLKDDFRRQDVCNEFVRQIVAEHNNLISQQQNKDITSVPDTSERVYSKKRHYYMAPVEYTHYRPSQLYHYAVFQASDDKALCFVMCDYDGGTPCYFDQNSLNAFACKYTQVTTNGLTDDVPHLLVGKRKNAAEQWFKFDVAPDDIYTEIEIDDMISWTQQIQGYHQEYETYKLDKTDTELVNDRTKFTNIIQKQYYNVPKDSTYYSLYASNVKLYNELLNQLNSGQPPTYCYEEFNNNIDNCWLELLSLIKWIQTTEGQLEYINDMARQLRTGTKITQLKIADKLEFTVNHINNILEDDRMREVFSSVKFGNCNESRVTTSRDNINFMSAGVIDIPEIYSLPISYTTVTCGIYNENEEKVFNAVYDFPD